MINLEIWWQIFFPQVSGLWQDEDDRALLLRETDVPVKIIISPQL